MHESINTQSTFFKARCFFPKVNKIILRTVAARARHRATGKAGNVYGRSRFRQQAYRSVDSIP